jgi:hypothetical protein
MKSWKIIKILLFFFAVALSIASFTSLWKSAPEIVENQRLVNARSLDWLRAAKCTQKTRKLFVFCEGDLIKPLEDLSLSDDRGHSLIFSLFALTKSTPVELPDLVRINLVISAIGILSLAATLLVFRLHLAAVLLIYLGFSFGLLQKLNATDVLSTSFGVYCLSLCSTVLICWLSSRKISWQRFFITVVLIVLMVGSASLIRQSIAIGPLVTGFIVLLLSWPKKKSPLKRTQVSICFVALYFAGFLIPTNILSLRTVFWNIPLSQKRIYTHGFSHTLLLGLGTEPNPWGIKWNDTWAEDKVHEIDPTIGYVSEAYYQTVRKIYFEKWKEAPLTVLKIYFVKLIAALNTIFHGMWWLLLGALAVTFVCLRRLIPQWKLRNSSAHKLLIFSCGLPILFILLMGTLANPYYTYYLDYGLLAISIFILVLVNVFLQREPDTFRKRYKI